jgi:hypothetical protein
LAWFFRRRRWIKIDRTLWLILQDSSNLADRIATVNVTFTMQFQEAEDMYVTSDLVKGKI